MPILFTTHTVAQESTMLSIPENPSNPPMHTIKGCISTIAVHHKLCRQKLSMHKSWWQMKLRLLHSIMLPYYTLWQLWSPIKNAIQTTVLVLLHPMLPYLTSPIYCASISATICGLLLVELTNLFNNNKSPIIKHPKKTPRIKNPHRHIYNICMFPSVTGPPLPSRRMVLNTVQLNQDFVGYLAKSGKHFIGFTNSMHRI